MTMATMRDGDQSAQRQKQHEVKVQQPEQRIGPRP